MATGADAWAAPVMLADIIVAAAADRGAVRISAGKEDVGGGGRSVGKGDGESVGSKEDKEGKEDGRSHG